MKTVMVLACLGIIAAGAYALTQDSGAQSIMISDAVAKPIVGEGAVAVLKIENTGNPDRLLSVTSNVAEVSLYTPVESDGLPIPSGGVASLALDAAHIAINASDAPLEDGTLLPVTLTFESAGQVNTRARISDPLAMKRAGIDGLFGFDDVCIVGEGEPAPGITLDIERDGDEWQVRINTEEFTFSKDLLGLYHVPGMGHGHLYVSGMKLERLFSNDATIGALPPGRHEVRVTLNTNDHRPYVVDDRPVTASAVITVD
jgi:copper(I)-binding protein